MRPVAATLFFLLTATLARAEHTNSLGFSFIASFLQMIAALAIVVGLILLTRHFAEKYLGMATKARFASKHIRLVETRYLAPKKALFLIEVGGAYYLLASSDENLTLVKQVDILEDIEVIENPGPVRASLVGIFRREKNGRKG